MVGLDDLKRKNEAAIPVFVYGSLKRHFGNHDILSKSEFLGEAVTKQEYTMLSIGGFPGVIKNGYVETRKKVIGEIFKVSPEVLFDRLDPLEGNGIFYNREIVETSLGPCWMYILLEESWGQPTWA